MSGVGMYRGGITRWADWLTVPRVWLLMRNDYVADIAHDTVADIAADECTIGGYARQAVNAPADASWVDDYTQYRAWGADPPSWAGLGTDETVGSLVLAVQGANDNQSGLIAWWQVTTGPDATEIEFSFGDWAFYGNPLPGGTATTHLLHMFQIGLA